MMNENLFYLSSTAAGNLNKVEGFNPIDYLSVDDSKGEERYYLDTDVMILWFRLYYPDGIIMPEEIKIDDRTSIIKTRLYTDRNNLESSLLSMGLSQRFYTNDEKGPYYLENAYKNAKRMALEDAGFGIQFSNLNVNHVSLPTEDNEENKPENTTHTETQTIKKDTKKEAEDSEKKNATNNNKMEQPQNNKSSEEAKQLDNTADSNIVQMGLEGSEKNDKKAEETANKPQPPTTKNEGQQQPPKVGREEISAQIAAKYKEMALEEIEKTMTEQEAENIIIPVAMQVGKTVCEVALADYRALKFYFSASKSIPPYVKAAAKLVFDRELNKAS